VDETQTQADKLQIHAVRVKILNQPALQKIWQPDAVGPDERAKHREDGDEPGAAAPTQPDAEYAEQ
jgi:hypothetical protein